MVCDIVPGQVGGSYLSALRFATLLRERGHHVILIGSRDSRQPRVKDYNGIPYYQFFAVPTPGSHRLYFQSFPTGRALEKVFRKERIEIVHIMFPSYSCYVAKRIAKKLGLPIVAHIHTQPENLYNFLPPFLQTKFTYDFLSRFLVRFVKDARQIVCPSELGKAQYQSIDPTLPISVISNGVDLAKFHQVDTQAFMEKYKLPLGQKYLLFVGRLMEEKGVETIVRALPEILRGNPGVHLNLVGSGPLMEKLRELARATRVDDHISLLGKLSDEDLLAAYNQCDLFTLPSKAELEGMVVLEAMACAKPILIADAPMSASRYFVRNNGLLCAPDDSHAYAVQALKILNNDELRVRMGEQSRLDARQYDIHESANRLEKVYESVL
jgi:1,2-diacylglycerol 3-alpha-glucosyltransferase